MADRDRKLRYEPPSSIVEREKLVIDTEAELDRDGHPGGLGSTYCRTDNTSQKARSEGQGGPSALASDFAHRAAEIHVDVIDSALTHKSLHRLSDIIRIDAIELQAARAFLRPKIGQLECFLYAIDQGACRDHFRDIKSCTELSTQRSKRVVCHTRHGGEHNGRRDQSVSELERGKLALTRQGYVAIDLALVIGALIGSAFSGCDLIGRALFGSVHLFLRLVFSRKAELLWA